MIKLLAHPLFILLVGVTLSGLLIPSITRRWQDRQRELELKTSFVSEVIEAIREILIVVQYCYGAVTRYEKIQYDKDKELVTQHEQALAVQEKSLDDAYMKWEVKSAVIETKLRLYFAETSIPGLWNRFAKSTQTFVALADVTQENQRTKLSMRFWGELPTRPPLEDPKDREKFPVQKKAILHNQEIIVQKILSSRVVPLRPQTLIARLQGKWRKWRLKRERGQD